MTIPNSITSISEHAFSGCSGLKSVTSLNTIPPVITSFTFDEKTERNATLNVPVGCKNIYWLHLYWENFANIVEKQDASDEQVNIEQIQNSDGDVIVANLRGERMTMKVDYSNT